MFVHWPHFIFLLFLLFITTYCVTANNLIQTFSDEACSKVMSTSINFEFNTCIMTPGAVGVKMTGQTPCGENYVSASGYFDDSCTNEATSSYWNIGSCLSAGFQGINSIRIYCLQIDGLPASSESQAVPSTSSTPTDITPISSSQTIDSSSATEGPSSTMEELPTTSSTLTTAVATSTTSVFPTQRSSQSSSAASDTQTSTTRSSPSSSSLPSSSVVTSTSSTNTGANSHRGPSTALKAVIAVLVVLAVALLIGIVLYWRHLKIKKDIDGSLDRGKNPPYQPTIGSGSDPTELRIASIRGWNMATANDVELQGRNTYAQRES